MDILEAPGFLEHVRAMADLFAEGFAELRASIPRVLVETRQRGLMMGLKMVNEMCGPLMTVAGFDHEVLTVYANNDTSVSQILPPLIISEEEARQVLSSLDAMLASGGGQAGVVRFSGASFPGVYTPGYSMPPLRGWLLEALGYLLGGLVARTQAPSTQETRYMYSPARKKPGTSR